VSSLLELISAGGSKYELSSCRHGTQPGRIRRISTPAVVVTVGVFLIRAMSAFPEPQAVPQTDLNALIGIKGKKQSRYRHGSSKASGEQGE